MPIIDLSFVLVGTTFPLDHRYSPYSAICRIILGLHGDCPLGHLGRSPGNPRAERTFVPGADRQPWGDRLVP